MGMVNGIGINIDIGVRFYVRLSRLGQGCSADRRRRWNRERRGQVENVAEKRVSSVCNSIDEMCLDIQGEWHFERHSICCG